MAKEDDKDWSELDSPDTNIPWFITIPFWIILIILLVIASFLADIRSYLRDIYSDTHYTSAAVDHLENIENILEDIKNK